MSTAMNFSSKSFKPRPPDKGAFPLDHFGECSAFKERFMQCLRDSGYESSACRQRAMAYLECRMERQVGPRRRGAEGRPGGPRGGEVAGLPLRGGEGTRGGGVRAGGLCPCEKQASFVASAVPFGLLFWCGVDIRPEGWNNCGTRPASTLRDHLSQCQDFRFFFFLAMVTS
ncbi:uncharacterized protein LOC129213066 isoform X1 [Grus americana]|uniref:uncharacterized protein LOC129213066 isoform X1 n=1 Tax=Grus americana TaxID=9117 RepID=UPI00240798C2|nr:uncharacterized protein LOC129213066 isoform X1 [Grus americana]